MWERACSRKRSVSHQTHRLIHRLREQARSHILTEYSRYTSTCRVLAMYS